MRNRHRRVAFAAVGTALAAAMLAIVLAVRIPPQPTAMATANEAAGLVSFQFVTPQTGFVHLKTNGDLIAKTTDGGHTWHEVLSVSGLTQTPLMQWTGAAYGFLVGQTKSSVMVWRTSDGGADWSRVPIVQPLPEWSSLETASFLDRNDGLVLIRYQPPCGGCGIVAERTIYRTSDGGAHWVKGARAVFGGQVWQSTMLSRSHVVLSSFGVLDPFQVSQDGGLTWQTPHVPFDWPACPIELLDCDLGFRTVHAFTSPTQGLLVISTCRHVVQMQRNSGCLTLPFPATSRDLYASTDSGVTWTKVRALPAGTGTVVIIDEKHALEVGADGLSSTHDGGVTWSSLGRTPVPVGWFVGAAQFTDTAHGFLVVTPSAEADGFFFQWYRSGPDPSARFSLLTTSDGGATWRNAVLPAA